MSHSSGTLPLPGVGTDRLTEQQLSQLVRYMDEILHINESINLTAIRDRDDFWRKHIWDSIEGFSAVAAAGLPRTSPILDLGTGGGFPLVPLAICHPEHSFVGVDSVNKKLQVVRSTAAAVGVRNVTLVHGRAEDLAHDPKYREQFGVCVSRAVAELRILLEYVVPFVRVGGLICCYKSVSVDEEIDRAQSAIRRLGVELETRYDYALPPASDPLKAGEEDARSILLFRKQSATDRRYPRKAGVPKKSPL